VNVRSEMYPVHLHDDLVNSSSLVLGSGNYRPVVAVYDVSANPEALTNGAFLTSGLGGSYNAI